MTKKTTLCVLVLAITGMLCAPVAAELQNEGDWTFFIVDKILAISDVKINGNADHNAWELQRVHVPASLDRVDVQFDVTWGPDTKLTITRGYIDMLKREYPDVEPVIYADGGCDTYDVDAGGLRIGADGAEVYFIVTIHEHLVKRGLVHWTPGQDVNIPTYDRVYDRFITGLGGLA